MANASGLQRLSEYARTNEQFVDLLRRDRAAALRAAADAGIVLTEAEAKLLRKVLARDRVRLTADEMHMVLSLDFPVGRAGERGAGPAFWPIPVHCFLIWKPYSRRRFAKVGTSKKPTAYAKAGKARRARKSGAKKR